MRRALPLVALTLSGCVYLNTLYNARRYYGEGERARLEGRSEEAREAYRAARDKAATSFRNDSLGRWAHSSLLLLGEAHLRLGDLPEGRMALERVLAEAEDESVRREARLYLGAVLAEGGEYSQALALLNESLMELDDGELRGEGHMWRARILLAQGHVDRGWWDLERAVEEDDRLAVPGHLERLAWAVVRADTARAIMSAESLLHDPGAGIWADSVAALVALAYRRWSPETAASLLSAARSAPWAPEPRDVLLEMRIDLLLTSGDTLAAETELGWMAQRSGPGSLPARLALSRIRLRRVSDVHEFDQVRRVLLPAATEPEVLPVLETLRVVEMLTDPEAGGFPATFAAGEIAAEVLDAERLARTFFLRAAFDSTGGAWRGKAVLASRAAGATDGELAGLRRQLLRARDPYLVRARNRYLPTDTLVALDAALQRELDSVLEWARGEAQRRDVLIRGGPGTGS